MGGAKRPRVCDNTRRHVRRLAQNASVSLIAAAQTSRDSAASNALPNTPSHLHA